MLEMAMCNFNNRCGFIENVMGSNEFHYSKNGNIFV